MIQFPEGALLRPSICLINASARVDDKWTSEAMIGDKKWIERRHIKSVERLVVPAGTYESLMIEGEYSWDEGGFRKQTQWFAVGIGLIKWKVRNETWVLKSFERGKD
jgi:hypothetical protein